MTDTVQPSSAWVTSGIKYTVYNHDILHICPEHIHIWNLDDKNNGTNSVYNNLVLAIQDAQVKDIYSIWKYIVIDISIESMSFFQSPNKPNCPSSILTELKDAFSNDGYHFVWLTGNVHAERNHKLWCRLNNVYVDESWVQKLPQKEDGEEDMLDMAYEPKKNSRLSCQIIVSDELDGLIVNIPSKQG